MAGAGILAVLVLDLVVRPQSLVIRHGHRPELHRALDQM